MKTRYLPVSGSLYLGGDLTTPSASGSLKVPVAERLAGRKSPPQGGQAKGLIAMTTTTTKLSAKDKAFRTAYGHLPSECLPGCIRPRANGSTSHRQSLKRPGDTKGMPFTETWEAMKLRKASRTQGANGPVVQVQAPTPKVPEPPANDARLTRLETAFLNLAKSVSAIETLLKVATSK